MSTDPSNQLPDESVDDLDLGLDRIAVIGMAARFPGSPDLDTFWANLVDGVDCLTTFTSDELEAIGIDPSITALDHFVPRGSIIDGYDRFDSTRFGFSPREAAMTDPQARLLLETTHAALEHAGYDPFAVPGEVGVFAGCNPVDHALLLGHPDPTDSLSGFDQMIGNDRDFLATRVSHRLGLTGPAFNVQTACSTSLVAIHLAAQHLLDHQCSTALAGGVSLNFRQGIGYFYQPGMILSPDGICRAFDDGANGTTLGQGAGVVVLKRLEDALADGDTIHGVIAASAINNDGDQKISYTAPSVEGQADAIATAHALADLTGDDITYVEAHGTGTKLGDPVEVAALTKAFSLTSEQTGHCAIGSVKTNIGHADAAAGVAGFIKAVLAVREAVIPKTLHFEQPNAAIDFENSPFRVAVETVDWQPTTTDLRRAGISSFGIGGTNAHVIVEEPPAQPAPQVDDRPTLLVGSAPTPNGAKATVERLSEWASTRSVGPAEANTLMFGRSTYDHRAVTVTNPESRTPGPIKQQTVVPGGKLLLAFSGQGAQFPGMAAGLYGRLEVFTAVLERAVDGFRREGDLDLLPLLLADRQDTDAAELLRQTEITQPALFAVQLAMAEQLAAWGVAPDALLGHSIGEFAAAATSGILTVDDAVRAVSARGRLMQSMPTGVMAATRLTADEISPFLVDGVEIAAYNSTRSTVVAGPEPAIREFEERLTQSGVDCQALATSHAFHSASMQPAADAFRAVLDQLDFRPPSRPMLSNVTGSWLTDEEAVDPSFWARQIRQPVRFADCLSTASNDLGGLVFCEVGPGRALSAFAAQLENLEQAPPTVQCLGHQREQRRGDVVALEAVGQLWATGISVDTAKVLGAPMDRRVPTPPSVLDGEACWLPNHRHVLALPKADASTATPDQQVMQRNPIDQWCYGRSWARRPIGPADQVTRIVAFLRDDAHHRRLTEHLRTTAADVITVMPGAVNDLTSSQWTLVPGDDDGMTQLFKRLEGTSRRPDRIVFGWLDDEHHDPTSIDLVKSQLDAGVNSLLALARAAAAASQDRHIHIDVLTRGAHDVLGGETVRPAAAAVAGPVKVIPLEYSGLTARQIDLPIDGFFDHAALHTALASAPNHESITAVRAGSQWVHRVEPIEESGGPTPLRRGGSYLVLGGLGGVGLSIAEHLARSYSARLTLTGRSGEPTPDREDPESVRRHERLEEVRTAADGLQIVRADITDAADVRRAVDAAREAFGSIDGVVVTAAVADTFGAIHRRSPEDAERAISAKVHGAVLLANALEGETLDFVMLSSSIASQLYHNRFGQVGYVTANSFAEAMAESGGFAAERVVAVAWDDWVDIGMSVRAAQDFATRHGEEISLMDELHSFAPADGVKVFEQALRPGPATVFVSTTDLRNRIEQDQFILSPFLEQAVASDGDAVEEVTSAADAVLSSWKSLLGIDDIGATDDFFDLGGDSLQVARMADRLSRALGVDVALDLIFSHPTFAALVEAIENLDGAADQESPDEAQDHERNGLVPLAPSQRRFFDRGSLKPHHFNVSVLLRPMIPVSSASIASAIATLEDRHSALRTQFEQGPDGWLQRVEPPGTNGLRLQEYDLRDVESATDRVAEIATELQSIFDIERRPLATVALFDLAGGEQRLLVVVHHLVSDRLSLLQLIDELDQLLAGVPLRTATTPFSNWSVEASAVGRSAGSLALLESWDEIVPRSDIALPGRDPAGNTNGTASATSLTFDAATSARLLRSGGVRSDEILLLALGSALRSWCESSQAIGIDVLGHGRRDLDLDVSRTLGFFLSYSPVWLPDSCTADELRRQLTTAWTFDPIRFAYPGATLHWTRPRVLFNYVGRPITSNEPRVLEVVEEAKGPDTVPENRRDHDLAFMVGISDADDVVVTAVFNRSQFDREEIDQLLELVQDQVEPTLTRQEHQAR